MRKEKHMAIPVSNSDMDRLKAENTDLRRLVKMLMDMVRWQQDMEKGKCFAQWISLN